MGVVGMVKAYAHEAASGWDYPLSCCFGTASGGDCQAISSKTVTPIAGGYRITLVPGDHNQVTKPHVFEVPADKVRISEDTSYHICLWPTEDKVQCFFAPPMSY
ncbi:hypothetical protein J1C56_01885 [Aminobacter anthyllidis]|uniref:Uncharacterized protein n=1 Tax=Aminobacter anthyllidis TaxID=1035067 RepID=A0A9X1D0W7_9HYPH|nr:hypothetical protein [Aminobacter anthyllidis]MBT1154335.1 hypothetical protein [Aminobacter anthyllidis]